MKQFTDGEWSIYDDTDVICGHHLIAMTSSGVGFSERYANVRLIQAAPEMYELLNKFSLCILGVNKDTSKLQELAEQADELLQRIDGLICD